MGQVAQLTADQIAGLKKKHGRLFQVDIKDGGEVFSAIFKEPNIDIISAATALSKSDEIKGSLVFYDNCKVLVDAEIEERDLLKMQVVGAIGERMTALSKTVKNL